MGGRPSGLIDDCLTRLLGWKVAAVGEEVGSYSNRMRRPAAWGRAGLRAGGGFLPLHPEVMRVGRGGISTFAGMGIGYDVGVSESIETTVTVPEVMPSAGAWIKRSSTTLLWLGIATLLLGGLAMAAPLIPGLAIAMMVGIMLTLAGIARLAFGFRSKSWSHGIVGLLVVLLGIFMLVRPGAVLASLTLVLGVYFFAHGLLDAIHAFQLRPVKGWGWVLVNALVSVVLGGMILAHWPASSWWVVGIFVGVNLLFTGVTMIWLSAAGRSLARDVDAAPQT